MRHTFELIPSAERTRQIALAKMYLSELVQMGDKTACAICALLFLSCESHIMSLPNLKQSGLLDFPSNAVHGIALASSAVIIDNCVTVCGACARQLQASVVPDFAPTTKWALSLVPPELSGLSLLERLLITKRFHVKHVLNYGRPNDGDSLSYKIAIKPLAGKTSYYQTNTLPISPTLLSLVFEIIPRINPHHSVDQFDCLVVREAHVRKALLWLKIHNRYYTDIDISLDALAHLPTNGIPQHWLVQPLGPKAVAVDDNFAQYGIGDLVIGHCFPCIFVDGHGPFEHYHTTDARKLGHWLSRHSDPRFTGHPALCFMVLNAIQQADYNENIALLPTTFDPRNFHFQVWQGNKLFARILGADSSPTKSTGELAGMILRLGQPNLYAELPMRENGIAAGRVFSGFDVEFDTLVAAFEVDIVRLDGLGTARAVATFYDTCQAFIHHIIGWNSVEDGLFGKINGYLGQVHQHETDGPIFHAVIWVDQPNSLKKDGYDTAAILARGDCHDGVWRPASSTNRTSTSLSPSFAARCINASTRFYPLLNWMPDSSLTPAQRSQSSYCYHSFLQPHIAPPVFQILLTEACLLAPAHGAELNRITDTIRRAIIKRPLTEFEVMSLIGGYENSLHSHTFVDVDSEGIFNVIMAYINEWVVYP